MPEPDDIALLKEYAETPFRTGVCRARRAAFQSGLFRRIAHVGNTHAAQEITQAVFIILARKAKSLARKRCFPAGCIKPRG